MSGGVRVVSPGVGFRHFPNGAIVGTRPYYPYRPHPRGYVPYVYSYPYYGGYYWGYPYSYYPYSGYGYGYPFPDYGYSSYDTGVAQEYAAQQQQLNAQVSDLSAQVQQLQVQNQELQGALSQPAAPIAPPPEQSPEPPAGASSPNAPAAVLIYKDGHRVEVRNYAIVGETVWILSDQRAMKVPLSQLDLPATRKENEQRGVPFNVPSPPKEE